MNLKLTRPLAFFDLETTGIQVGNCLLYTSDAADE